MGVVGTEQVVRMNRGRNSLINILLTPQLNVSLGFFSDTLPVFLIKCIVSLSMWTCLSYILRKWQLYYCCYWNDKGIHTTMKEPILCASMKYALCFHNMHKNRCFQARGSTMTSFFPLSFCTKHGLLGGIADLCKITCKPINLFLERLLYGPIPVNINSLKS